MVNEGGVKVKVKVKVMVKVKDLGQQDKERKSSIISHTAEWKAKVVSLR